MSNDYQKLSDKYITLLTEVQVFMDKIEDELQEPKEDTLDNIKELSECYNKLFKLLIDKGMKKTPQSYDWGVLTFMIITPRGMP